MGVQAPNRLLQIEQEGRRGEGQGRDGTRRIDDVVHAAQGCLSLFY